MKRWAAIGFVFLLTACSGETATPDGGERREGGVSTDPISIQVFGEPEETRIYHTLIEQYAKENPGTDVKLVEIAERDDHLARLSTSFAGGEPPDIFLINYREYSQFVARGAIQPIEDLLTERGLDLEDYYEPPREAFTFDDQLQCMPQNISSLAVY
jgi:multiple sugar transport system substrate-binding protein